MSTVAVDKAKLERLLEAARAILPPEFKVKVSPTGFDQVSVKVTPKQAELRDALWHVEQEVKG